MQDLRKVVEQEFEAITEEVVVAAIGGEAAAVDQRLNSHLIPTHHPSADRGDYSERSEPEERDIEVAALR